jgi:hypothetical protein
VEPKAWKVAFPQDSLTIASTTAKKAIKDLQASPNIKEKGLGENPTLRLILMALQGHHLSIQLSYPHLRFIA